MESESSSTLPPFLAVLFWDVDPRGLDAETDRDFVIGRILSAGTLKSIQWARSRYGDDALRDWIVRHEGRQLSGPQIRFWETVIGLPTASVNGWLATPERRIWEGRAASICPNLSRSTASCSSPRPWPSRRCMGRSAE
jgi:hypothetical protein